ncbi:hypothetical protein BV20DRAFT_423686 [Pilatotrama ljubarskyi]|nr:hypothetical protein BV20DRAFT_423686 [Pilatotrama ljubarskyi]
MQYPSNCPPTSCLGACSVCHRARRTLEMPGDRGIVLPHRCDGLNGSKRNLGISKISPTWSADLRREERCRQIPPALQSECSCVWLFGIISFPRMRTAVCGYICFSRVCSTSLQPTRRPAEHSSLDLKLAEECPLVALETNKCMPGPCTLAAKAVLCIHSKLTGNTSCARSQNAARTSCVLMMCVCV